MEKQQKAAGRQKALIVLFLLAVFLPAALGAYCIVTKKEIDVPLKGYTTQAKTPAASVSAWTEGRFQQEAADWIAEKIRPRGVMIKTYNTINLLLFKKKSGMVAGKGYDLYEPRYIEAELGLTAADDYAKPENDARLDAYVAELVQLQEKLKKVGKTLVYYIGPSKASGDRANLPEKALAMDRQPLRAVDAMREKLSKTEIPFLVSADTAAETAYPAFYPTGIHWSRPYEQAVSAKLIRLMTDASGKNYRQLELGEAEASEVPYDRDADLLDLANVFYKPKVTYYQFKSKMEETAEYDRLRLMTQGDSFALGLKTDVIANDPEAVEFHVTRDESVGDRWNKFIGIYGDWSNMPWQYYLDRTDVIALEASEALIGEENFGFVKALNAALESYVPGTGATAQFSPAERTGLDDPGTSGIYGYDDGFCWTKPYFTLTLDEGPIREAGGMQITLEVPEELCAGDEDAEVTVTVNGREMETLSVSGGQPLVLWYGAEELAMDGEGVRAEIRCSRSFVPAERNPESGDTRELALRIIYAGGGW